MENFVSGCTSAPVSIWSSWAVRASARARIREPWTWDAHPEPGSTWRARPAGNRSASRLGTALRLPHGSEAWTCARARSPRSRRSSPGIVSLITFWDVLEHVRDPREELQIARRLLRRGGVIAATMPNVEGWYPRVTYRRDRTRSRPVGVSRATVHLYDFSPATLGRLLQATPLPISAFGRTRRPSGTTDGRASRLKAGRRVARPGTSSGVRSSQTRRLPSRATRRPRECPVRSRPFRTLVVSSFRGTRLVGPPIAVYVRRRAKGGQARRARAHLR